MIERQMRSSELLADATKKSAFISIVLVTNAFVWYYFIIELLMSAVQRAQISSQSTMLVWVLHFGGIALSALAGASISKRIGNKTYFILYWMLLGAILSAVSIGLNLAVFNNLLLMALLFGVFLGFGMPSCMSYFADSVGVERRGRVGGTIFLLTCLFIVALGMLAGIGSGLETVVLTGWRLVGVIVFFFFLKSWTWNLEVPKNDGKVSYSSLLSSKTFLLFVVPWLMFAIINNLTIPLQADIISGIQKNGVHMLGADSLMSIENLLGAISGFIGGFLIDLVGRKRMSIIAFALLGLGYAALGVASGNPASWYFYTCVDGITWGILFVIFVITIWADISNGLPCEKFYAVGVLPFFVTFFIRLAVGFDLRTIVSEGAIFSFVAFFLFLAVLPLVYAPETLPEKTMKDRDLKSYAEKAVRQANKEAEKLKTFDAGEVEEEAGGDSEDTGQPRGYDEAMKLAEKYY